MYKSTGDRILKIGPNLPISSNIKGIVFYWLTLYRAACDYCVELGTGGSRGSYWNGFEVRLGITMCRLYVLKV